jgi:hypothetical protein
MYLKYVLQYKTLYNSNISTSIFVIKHVNILSYWPQSVRYTQILVQCSGTSAVAVIHSHLRFVWNLRPGTHYPHVTWAPVILRVQLGYLTLNSGANPHFSQHVIWREALVGSRASTPLKFLLSHTFRETWRTCRVLFSIVTRNFQKWRKCLLKKCANGHFYMTPSHQSIEISIWEPTHGKK